MKRFKLIVPSFIAIIFCMLLIAGSTFALFTSEAEASISVTSGKVEISASLDNLKLYSADHEYTTGEEAGEILANDELWANYAGKYYFKPQTGSFANGGTAAVTGSNLAIEKMTPGDKVELDLTVTNTSNVNIKYRVVIEASYKVGTRTYDQALAYALKTTIGNTTKTSLSAYKSNWILLTAGTSQNPAPLHLEFELPLLAGNDYQDSGVLFSFKVEAVQANAATNGEESFEVISGYSKTKRDTTNANKVVAKNIVVDKDAAAAATPENPDAGKLTVEATVTDTITSTTFKDANDEYMTDVTSTQLEVSDLFLTKDEFTNETTISADVQLKDQDGNNIKSSAELVKVEVFVGKGFSDVKVIHNGQAPMTQKTSAENLAENESYYNTESGIVTFMTKSFSPYTFVGDFEALLEHVTTPTPTYTYYGSLLDAVNAAVNGDTVYVLKDVKLTQAKALPGGQPKYGMILDKSITLDGKGHEISTTCDRVFGVEGTDSQNKISLTLSNLYLRASANSAAQVLWLGDNIQKLTMNNVVADNTASTSGYVQAITVGYSDDSTSKRNIELNNCKILNRENIGYAMIFWTKVDLVATNTDITGWTALYFKNSTDNSSVTMTDGSLKSKGKAGNSNSFATIVFESGSNAVNLTNTNVSVSNDATDTYQAFVSFSEWFGPNTGNEITLNGGNVKLSGAHARMVTEKGSENSLTITNANIDNNGTKTNSYSYESPELENMVAYMYMQGTAVKCDGYFDFNQILPYSSAYFCNGEWFEFYSATVTLTDDVDFEMAQLGWFGLILGESNLDANGHKLTIAQGVTIKTDKQLAGVFAAPQGFTLVETELTGDATYSYSYTVQANQ